MASRAGGNNSTWVTPSGVQKQPPGSHAQTMSERQENFRVLKRVPLDPAKMPIKFREPQDDDTTIAVIGCETTGLGRDDSIMELGMVRCRYGASGNLAGVDRRWPCSKTQASPSRRR